MPVLFYKKIKYLLFSGAVVTVLAFAISSRFINFGSDSENITTISTAGFMNTQNHTTTPALTDEKIVMTTLPHKNYLLGKLTLAQSDSVMVTIQPGYANRQGLLMHREAYDSFKKMHQKAREDGVELTIISAFRTFAHQKRIWENKWNGRQPLSGNIMATSIADPVSRALEILKFSSMPGTSRHHWGTDIDINSLNNNYFNSGKGKKEYEWLLTNAAQFGFHQPYSSRHERNNMGYEEEKWHWSFIPIANTYLNAFQLLINYNDLTGFDGSETSQKVNVIQNYVMAIDKKCLNNNGPLQP